MNKYKYLGNNARRRHVTVKHKYSIVISEIPVDVLSVTGGSGFKERLPEKIGVQRLRSSRRSGEKSPRN